MEDDKNTMWTFPNRNGRSYNVNKMIDSIKDWAQNNGAWFDKSIKDVNAFYREKKNPKNTNKLEQYIIDPQSIFIDYIGLLRP